jgi:hypothetical protein
MRAGGRQHSTDDSGRGRQPEQQPDTSAVASGSSPHLASAGPNPHLILNRPYAMNDRTPTLTAEQRQLTGSVSPVRQVDDEDTKPEPSLLSPTALVRCINPASEVNARLDTQVEVRVYPCNNSQSSSGKKKFTTFTVKPEVSTSYKWVVWRFL